MTTRAWLDATDPGRYLQVTPKGKFGVDWLPCGNVTASAQKNVSLTRRTWLSAATALVPPALGHGASPRVLRFGLTPVFLDERLRLLTGRDTAVISFLEANEAVGAMLEDIHGFVERWLPCFERDNRSYLTIAIGCTGGRHRSVYLAESLARQFQTERPVLLRHRELTSAELLPRK